MAGNRPATLFVSPSSSGLLLSAQITGFSEAAQVALLDFRRQTQLAGLRNALAGATPPPPKSDESIDTYMIRIIEKSAADRDWMQLRDTLELYRSFFESARTPAWLRGDIVACTAYLGALNLDLAEQYTDAVTNYQKALQNAGRYTPVQAIAKRLAEIKKDHPEAMSAPPPSSRTLTDQEAYATKRAYTHLPSGDGPSIPDGPLVPRSPSAAP
jgi:hypothetical protein